VDRVLKTVKLEIKAPAKASRWELAVRLVYWIPLYIVLVILGMLAGLCWFVQLLLVVFTGSRNATLAKFVKAFVEYHVKFTSYYLLLTDERPEVIPEF